jgi:hypothetical protein
MSTDVTSSLVVSAAWREPWRTIAADVANNMAAAWEIRAEHMAEGHQSPFYIEVLTSTNVHVQTVCGGGSIRDARRRRDQAEFDAGPGHTAVLTDCNGKAIR